MAQIGQGLGVGWPAVLDTPYYNDGSGQFNFQNGLTPIADSNKRYDAEILNDVGDLLLKLEQILGLTPQGASATVTERIAAVEATLGSGALTTGRLVYASGAATLASTGAVQYEAATGALSLGAGSTPTAAADSVKLSEADTDGLAGKGALLVTAEDGTRHTFGHVVGLGVTTGLATGTRLQVRSLDGDTGNVVVENYLETTNGPNLTARHARGTAAAPARVTTIGEGGGGFRAEAWARDAGDTADGWQTLGLMTGVVESLDAQGRIASALWFRTSSGVSAAVSAKARLTALGNFCLGSTNAGTNAACTLMLGPGTAPSTSPADSVQLWAQDRGGVAGKRALHVMAEDLSMVVIGDQSGFGTTDPKFKLEVAGRLGFSVPNSGGQDTNLGNSMATMYLSADELSLIIRVKSSTGTLRSATLTLT